MMMVASTTVLLRRHRLLCLGVSMMMAASTTVMMEPHSLVLGFETYSISYMQCCFSCRNRYANQNEQFEIC